MPNALTDSFVQHEAGAEDYIALDSEDNGKKSKKKERKEKEKWKKGVKAAKAAKAKGANVAEEEETTQKEKPNPVFTYDLGPSKAAHKESKTKSAADSGSSSSSDSDSGSGSDSDSGAEKAVSKKSAETPKVQALTRADRRRVILIKKQREKIQKQLKVTPGSDERKDEVELEVRKWTAKRLAIEERNAAKRKEKGEKLRRRLEAKKHRKQLAKQEMEQGRGKKTAKKAARAAAAATAASR